MTNRIVVTPLRHLRRARTLSQADLAKLADVSQQTISKAERGVLHLTPDVQIRIATILGAPRSEVFPTQAEAVAS
jgi:transcriptional regulator with XRE-family HTH domain